MRPDTVKNCKIIIGCFVIQLLTTGAGRLSSIYFVESITRYNVDRKQASFPFILLYLVKNLSGPAIGYLEQIFGIKWIITFGCFLCTVSIGCCVFAEDILVITLLWGAALGFSSGLTFNLQAPLLGQHFKENRNKANAFVLVGSSIGAIMLPIIATDFIQAYGISGSYLILSGIIAHSIPASLLLENYTKNISKEQKNTKNITLKPNYNEDSVSKINTDALDKNNITNGEIFIKGEYLSVEQTPELLSSSSVENISYKHGFKINIEKNFELCSINSQSTVSISEATNNVKESESKESFFNKKKFTFQNFRIFIDPTFIVILIIHGLTVNVIVTTWTVILDFVRDKNVPENLEIYYVILFPIIDIFGRLAAGYISDKNFITVSNLCLINFLVKAAVLTSMVHTDNFILLMVFEIILSICIGMAIVLLITMTDDFMEEDLKKMSHTCRFMLYPPLSLYVSPMLGYFREGQGSYDNVFYILSGASLICGCCAYLLPYISKKNKAPK